MARYYAVEQDGKRNNKMDSQNNLNCVVFPPFLGFALSTTKFKAFCFPWAIIMVSLTLFSSFAQALAIDM